MLKYMPKDIIRGKKQGFSAPDASWFKGESMNFVRKKLYEGDPFIYEFIDRDYALNLIDDHMQGKKNKRLLIWSLINFESWLENNFE